MKKSGLNINSDGIRGELSYLKVYGKESGKKILGLHGLACCKEDFLPVAKKIEDYTWILPDLPGHGESNFPYVNWEIINDSLDSLLEAEKVDEFVPVGHSFGGMVAMQYSLLNKHRINGLFIANSSAYLDKDMGDFLTRNLVFNKQNLMEKIYMGRRVFNGDPSGIYSCAHMAFNFDLRKALEKEEFGFPTMVVGTDNDFFFSNESIKYTAENLGAKLRAIEGVHSSLIFNSLELTKKLKEFLYRC